MTWSATSPTAASSSRCAWSREPTATPLIETSFIAGLGATVQALLGPGTLGSGRLRATGRGRGARRADVVRRGAHIEGAVQVDAQRRSPRMSSTETTGATTTGAGDVRVRGGISTATPETVTTGISPHDVNCEPCAALSRRRGSAVPARVEIARRARIRTSERIKRLARLQRVQPRSRSGEAMDDLEQLRLLGRGAMGSVHVHAPRRRRRAIRAQENCDPPRRQDREVTCRRCGS